MNIPAISATNIALLGIAIVIAVALYEFVVKRKAKAAGPVSAPVTLAHLDALATQLKTHAEQIAKATVTHTDAMVTYLKSEFAKAAPAVATPTPEPAAPAAPAAPAPSVASAPPPAEAAPAAATAAQAPGASGPAVVAASSLADSYPSKHDLVAAAAALKTVYAITVDGVQVWPGFGPPDDYFTQPNGSVSKIKPTPAVMAPVGSAGALAESYPNAAALEEAVAALKFTGAVQLDGKIIHAGFGKADGSPWAYTSQPDGTVKAA